MKKSHITKRNEKKIHLIAYTTNFFAVTPVTLRLKFW